MGLPRKLKLAGVAEAAAILGVSRSTIVGLRDRPPRMLERRPTFPKPIATLRCGPIWTREELIEYRAIAKRMQTIDEAELLEIGKRERRRKPKRHW